VTVADARAALIDKIEDIASLRENYMDSRPTPSVHDEIAAFEKSVREDACTQERLRMHRLLGYAIDCLIMEAEEIHVSCLPGLRVADSLVDP
jgi:hypothetical protein